MLHFRERTTDIVCLGDTVKVQLQRSLNLFWAMWNEFKRFLDDKSRKPVGVEDEIAPRRPLISKYRHDTLSVSFQHVNNV